MKLQQLVGEILDQKYQIEKMLGQGGMGAVFLATHLGTQRSVAVKVISPKFMENQEFVERFKREAVAAGRLRHPNVVNVTDFGFAAIYNTTVAYLVMEYLEGLTLADLLQDKGILPVALAIDIVEQICLAMERAHALGIIHRDLKPQNIWLEPDGRGRYHAKVLDFGLAKLHDMVKPTIIPPQPDAPTELYAVNARHGPDRTTLAQSAMALEMEPAAELRVVRQHVLSEPTDEVDIAAPTELRPSGVAASQYQSGVASVGITTAGAVLGTPLYMSPEQCLAQEPDLRSDIYNLGIILYQMLCGELPFTGSYQDLIRQHTQSPPPSLKKKRRHIPRPLANLVLEMLAKNPAQRPPNCQAVGATLRMLLDGEATILQAAKNIHHHHRLSFFILTLLIFAPFILASEIIMLIRPNFWMILLVVLAAQTACIATYTLALRQLHEQQAKCRIDKILLSLFPKLPTLLKTAMWRVLLVLWGMLRFIVPGLKAWNEHSLYAPVVILEDKQGQEAIRRSEQLMNRVRYPAVALQLFHLLLALLIALTIVYPFVFSEFDLRSYFLEGNLLAALYLITVCFTLPLLLSVACTPYAIAVPLLYLQMRRVVGESATMDFDAPAYQEAHMISMALYTKTTGSLLTVLARLALTYLILLGMSGIVTSLSDRTQITYAAYDGKNEQIRRLLAQGVPVDLKDGFGRTALVAAVQNGRKEIVKLLLEHGAYVDTKSFLGFTPLMLSIKNKHSEVVQILIAHGAQINTQNRHGDTALITAVKYNQEEIAKILLAAHADTTIHNREGKTALRIAQEKQYVNIMKMLEAASSSE